MSVVLRYATRPGLDGTFTLAEDGPVLLVFGHHRRTDVAAPLDLVLPCFPLTASRWRPAYERDLFLLRRVSENMAEVLGFSFGRGDRDTLFLAECPEVRLNEVFRIGERLASQHTHPTRPYVRRP